VCLSEELLKTVKPFRLFMQISTLNGRILLNYATRRLRGSTMMGTSYFLTRGMIAKLHN